MMPLFITELPFPVLIGPFNIKFPVEEIVRVPDADNTIVPLKVKSLFRVVL